MKRPIIGITLDYEDDQKYSTFPYYALRANYINAVIEHGGHPILLPFEIDSISTYVDIIDGLIITGGNFDISPTLYGEESFHETTTLKESRTKFEWGITLKAIQKQLPILGICGGMQLVNVIFGGNLIQHIPDTIDDHIEHEAKPYDATSHSISIKENSKLYALSDHKNSNRVNSSHHQAVGKVGNNMKISATASDGVIEAIESSDESYMIGVQWHPEYQLTNLDKNLFKNFIENC